MCRLTLVFGICLLLFAPQRARAADQIFGIHLLSWTSDSLLVELGISHSPAPTLSKHPCASGFSWQPQQKRRLQNGHFAPFSPRMV